MSSAPNACYPDATATAASCRAYRIAPLTHVPLAEDCGRKGKAETSRGLHRAWGPPKNASGAFQALAKLALWSAGGRLRAGAGTANGFHRRGRRGRQGGDWMMRRSKSGQVRAGPPCGRTSGDPAGGGRRRPAPRRSDGSDLPQQPLSQGRWGIEAQTGLAGSRFFAADATSCTARGGSQGVLHPGTFPGLTPSSGCGREIDRSTTRSSPPGCWLGGSPRVAARGFLFRGSDGSCDLPRGRIQPLPLAG